MDKSITRGVIFWSEALIFHYVLLRALYWRSANLEPVLKTDKSSLISPLIRLLPRSLLPINPLYDTNLPDNNAHVLADIFFLKKKSTRLKRAYVFHNRVNERLSVCHGDVWHQSDLPQPFGRLPRGTLCPSGQHDCRQTPPLPGCSTST